MNDHEWQARASCQGYPQEYFFDETGNVYARPSAANRARRWRAKQVCATCPVAMECLRHAERANAEFGVYGGLDQRERAAMRGARKDRPMTSAMTEEISARFESEGLPEDEIAERLHLTIAALRTMRSRARPTSGLVLAAREYEAWTSVGDGRSPAEVAVRHRLPFAHAEDMCQAMDKLPDYTGPKGRQRYAYRMEEALATSQEDTGEAHPAEAHA